MNTGAFVLRAVSPDMTTSRIFNGEVFVEDNDPEYAHFFLTRREAWTMWTYIRTCGPIDPHWNPVVEFRTLSQHAVAEHLHDLCRELCFNEWKAWRFTCQDVEVIKARQAAFFEEWAQKQGYTVDADGDVCRDDELAFWCPVFEPRGKGFILTGFKVETGKVVDDAYEKGDPTQTRHVFEIERRDGSKFEIQAFNLYRNPVWMKPRDEETRKRQLAEKHARGWKYRAYKRESRTEFDQSWRNAKKKQQSGKFERTKRFRRIRKKHGR